MIRKREPRWQSAAERARVAAELIEEAESLTETSSIASPADVVRAGNRCWTTRAAKSSICRRALWR